MHIQYIVYVCVYIHIHMHMYICASAPKGSKLLDRAVQQLFEGGPRASQRCEIAA